MHPVPFGELIINVIVLESEDAFIVRATLSNARFDPYIIVFQNAEDEDTQGTFPILAKKITVERHHQAVSIPVEIGLRVVEVPLDDIKTNLFLIAYHETRVRF